MGSHHSDRRKFLTESAALAGLAVGALQTVDAQTAQSGTRLKDNLAYGQPSQFIPLGNAKPVKIEGSLVPYATTVWDFINRAMPWTRPGTLTPNEVYAVTAYVLFLNGIVQETDILDATTLPRIRMPNRDNFVAVEIDLKPGQRRPLGHYP